MKISKSKQELARIISENGGWRDGAEFSSQDKDGEVFHYATKPTINAGCEVWHHKGCIGEGEFTTETLPNWHQTILSRDEYLHLYPVANTAPDADGWIEWKGGECPVGGDVMVVCKARTGKELSNGKKIKASILLWRHTGGMADIIAYRLHKPEQAKSTAVGDDETNLAAKEELEAMEHKPTIEQLAADYRNAKDCADRKQQEADAAKADAEAKLAELVAAGKELGLVLSVVDALSVEPEPELVITDWRDLRVGDEVALTSPNGGGVNVGEVGEIMRINDRTMSVNFPSQAGHLISRAIENWRFIRRP